MRGYWLSCILGLLPCGFLISAAQGDEPWDSPAFSAKAEVVHKAAAALVPPKDANVDYLLVETHYVFDRQGRRQVTVRQVLRFVTPKGVSDFASIDESWSPWCEERPQLRARVMGDGGTVHELDPRSIGEAPIEQEPNIWSDRKVLRAPLPAVRSGCVAETEIVLRETQPCFAQGVVKHSPLAFSYPVRKLRLIIDYPVQLPVRYLVRGSNLKPLRTESGGMSRLVFELQDVKPLKLRDIEWLAPAELPIFPEVIFSTGQSWQEVSGGYEALVEKQIDLDAVRTIAREAAGQGASREQTIARLLAKVQQLVRYTGIEFGNSTIVPQSSRDMLARRYGDCKDQATLLVAMLRSVGLPAYVALICAGSQTDIARDLPGMGEFNHAIVCVNGNPPLWLDPTDNYTPAGQLPLSDQGRWTLVVSHYVTTPIKTPVADYHQNRSSKLVEYTLADGGSCRVRENLREPKAPAQDESAASWRRRMKKISARAGNRT